MVETGESRDGKGAGDRDVPFEWCHPTAILNWHEQWHLLVLRGRCMDGGPSTGDTDLLGEVEVRESGLIVPVPVGPDISALWKDESE